MDLSGIECSKPQIIKVPKFYMAEYICSTRLLDTLDTRIYSNNQQLCVALTGSDTRVMGDLVYFCCHNKIADIN